MRVGYYLLNFDSEVDIITLSDQIEIKRKVSSFGVLGSEYIDEFCCACIEGGSPKDVERIAVALVYGLRLFKTGPVGIDEGYIESETSPSDFPKEKIPDLWFLRLDVGVSGTYVIRKNEIQPLQRFFKKFLGVGKIKDPLAHAMHRFNRGIESDSAREAFVDFMITLETLFLEGRTGEMRYKLANRVASLIGGKESYKLCNEVKKLYDLRSKIVHSGGIGYEELQKKKDFLESLARRSILSVLALRQKVSPKKLPTKLDECMHDTNVKRMLRKAVKTFWKGVDFPANVYTD